MSREIKAPTIHPLYLVFGALIWELWPDWQFSLSFKPWKALVIYGAAEIAVSVTVGIYRLWRDHRSNERRT